MKVLIFLLFLSSTYASQFQSYIDEGCDKVIVDLAKEYLNSNKSEKNLMIDLVLQDKYNNFFTLNSNSLTFCGVKDLEQGSWGIPRFVELCAEVNDYRGNSRSASLYLKTQGNLFCDNEKVLGFEDIWLD